MIVTKNVNKYFGATHVLKDISFQINRGEIVGFLGLNGAGKTTLMRILTNYLSANSGEVLINNENVETSSLSIRRKIGYLPESPPLYPSMTVYDYLMFAAQLKDVAPSNQKAQTARVSEECGLENVQNKTIGILSKGFQQRVGIAQAIINEPEVIILDEPTNGLDPLQILQVRNLINSFRGKRTVILSTHILSEIEQIAERVLVIHDGRILTDAPLKELLKSHDANLENTFLSLVSTP